MNDVLVLGAGISGLTAARALVRAGLDVAVIEARDRIGGRVHTLHDARNPAPIELGAELVHEASARTKRYLREAELALHELSGERLVSQNGKLEATPFDDRVAAALTHAFRSARAHEDRSIADAVAHTNVKAADRELVIGFVEGFHAGDAKEMSAKALARGGAEGPGRMLRVDRGYGALVDAVAGGLGDAIHLGRRVTRVAHRKNEVRVTVVGPTGRVAELVAKKLVVALPPGPLRAIDFDPPLERARLGALDHIGMADVKKVTLRFRECFWPEKAALIHAPGEVFPTFWTARPRWAPILVAWAGGPAAKKIAHPAEQACESLARILRVRAAKVHDALETFHCHDWSTDPLAQGAYSFARVGGVRAAAIAAKAIGKTVFFAGEHTCAMPENATVEGAIAAGERAAEELLG